MGFQKGNTYGLKHGLSKTLYHRLWRRIKAKCYNQNDSRYKWYGAKGIKIYNGWLNDFILFYNYIIQLPGANNPELSLDRINNNGNYEPGNLRWADASTQIYNQGLRVDNQTGYKGINFPKKLNKYRVRVRISGRTYNVGVFNNLEKAIIARDIYIHKNDPNQELIKQYYNDSRCKTWSKR